MAGATAFTVGGRDYRLDPDPALRAAVLSCPAGPDAPLARAAAGRARLVPPTVARPDAGAAYLVPSDAAILDGTGAVLAGDAPADADALLRVLAPLLDDLRAELPLGPFALPADPADIGFVLAPGRRLTLLPHALVPADAPDSAGAADVFVRLLHGLAGSPLLGDGGAAWAWFAGRLDAARASVGDLAGLAADALRRLGLAPAPAPAAPLPACKACGARFEDATDACPACGKPFRRIDTYALLDSDWLAHPRLGRKRYAVGERPAGVSDVPPAALNAALADLGDARVLDTVRVSSGRLLVVFGEPPSRDALNRVRQTLAAATPPAPPPAPPPPPPVPTAVACGGCGAAIVGGRKFCPKCGAAVAGAKAVPVAAAAPDDAPGAKLEAAGGATRWAATADGKPAQVIDAPEPGGFADVVAALGADADRPRAFPAVLDTVRRGNRTRVTVDAAGEVPWLDWCRIHRRTADFFDRFGVVVEDLLAALAALHAAGWYYGGHLADRVRVANDPPAARLDWPLAPRRPRTPVGVKALLGYTPPEFGDPARPPGADADVFAAAAAVLAGLLGRDPPPSLSRDDLDLPHVRAWVPDLPAGWGGWLEKALAKRPPDRFASPAAALTTWRDLLALGDAPAGWVAAAALHVGVGKTKSNPRNQDRVVLLPLPGEAPARAPLDPPFPPEENFVTAEAACPGAAFVAVADGISTVSSGELAAAAAAVSLAAGAAALPAGADPGPALARLFEAANADLGAAVAAAAPDRPKLTTASGCPSATLAAALLAPDRAAVANLGDSRVYLLRAGVLDQLTIDGDEGTRHLLAGLDADAALDRDDAKELLGWVGRFEPAVDAPNRVDPTRPVAVTTGPGFSTVAFRPRAGDVYLCCSDGVSDYADGGLIDLAAELAAHPPAEACRRLVAAANAAGGGDNISAAVVRAAAPDPASSPRTGP